MGFSIGADCGLCGIYNNICEKLKFLLFPLFLRDIKKRRKPKIRCYAVRLLLF